MTESVGRSKLAVDEINPSKPSIVPNARCELPTIDDWNKYPDLKFQCIRLGNNLDSVTRKIVLLEKFLKYKYGEDFVKYLKTAEGAEILSDEEDTLCEVSQSSLLSAPEEQEGGETYICPRDEDLSVNLTVMTLLSLTTNSSVVLDSVNSRVSSATSFVNSVGNDNTLCERTQTSSLSISMGVGGETYMCPRNEDLSVNSTMMTCLSITTDSSLAAKNSTSSFTNATGNDSTLCGETLVSSLSICKEGEGETYVCDKNEDSVDSLTKMTFLSESIGNSDSDMFDSEDDEENETSANTVGQEIYPSSSQKDASLRGTSLSSCGHQTSYNFDGRVECSLCHQNSLHIKSILEQEQEKKNNLIKNVFQCTLCPKTFRRKFCLERHQDTHNPDKPYACSMCPKTFRRITNLQEHEYIHKTDVHLKCPKCPMTFARKRNFRRHMSIKHTPTDSAPSQ